MIVKWIFITGAIFGLTLGFCTGMLLGLHIGEKD